MACRTTLVLVGQLLLPSLLAAQSDAELVRGRVRDSGGVPLSGATITITAAVSQQVRVAHSNERGEFSSLFADGGGPYTVLVRRIGYTPATLSARRTGISNVVTIDAALTKSAYPLDPITVRASAATTRPQVERPSIGGTEQSALAVGTFLSDPGDLNALLALTPGVRALGDSAYSVMGASPEQNSRVVDGMRFDGSILPPDAMCAGHLMTSTSDPSRGRFAGGQFVAQTCRGGESFASTVRASFADPLLSSSDPDYAIPPARVGAWSGFMSGALSPGASHFRLSFSGSTRLTASPSLLSAASASLAQFGLLPDTVARFKTTIAGLGVPLTNSTIPLSSERRNAAAFLSVDWNPGAAVSLLLTASGSLATTDAVNLNANSLPSLLGGSSQRTGRIFIRGTSYIAGFVDNLTTVLSSSSRNSAPYVNLPTGSVLVGSSSKDGGASLVPLAFGGGASANHSIASSWSTRNEMLRIVQFHQVRIGQELTFDWIRSTGLASGLGTYVYQSLDDLAANRPSSYSRTFGTADQSSHSLNAASWLADTWKASTRVSLEGGIRLDWASLGSAPAYNEQVDALFGHRTDKVPADFGVSPRLGFVWLVKPAGRVTVRLPNGQLLHAAGVQDNTDIPNYPVPRGNFGSGTTLYGNIGAFRGVIPVNRYAGLVDHTGLPGATQALACVGDASPIPAWSGSNGAVFTECRAGQPSTYASNRPNVLLLDPAARAPLDWKLSFGLNGTTFGEWAITPSVVLVRELNTSGRIDLNLRRDAGFSLASEGNRPVFVAPQQIVSTTGTISPNASRAHVEFAQVMNSVSDLHRSAGQFNLAVSPPPAFSRIQVRFNYSYNAQQNELRGFDGTTAGDPFVVERVSGAQPLHEFVATAPAFARIWWFTTGLRAIVSSGTGYTPFVMGDINGDGLSNDLAFITNPSVSADSALGAEMDRLLGHAPASARACLLSQMGRVAAANSCRGPWQFRLDLAVDFTPPRSVAVTDRLHITTRFFNAGAAIMRMLGVSSAIAGASTPRDERLLFVTGFDPAAQRFKYRVNQAFGQPLDLGAGSRGFPPFQIQLGVQYQLGAAPNIALLSRNGLIPTRYSATWPEDVRAVFRRIARENPVDGILALRDSLTLTSEQVTALEGMRSQYQRTADSVIAQAVTGVVGVGKKLSDNDFVAELNRMHRGIDGPREAARDAALSVLTSGQTAILEVITGRESRSTGRPQEW